MCISSDTFLVCFAFFYAFTHTYKTMVVSCAVTVWIVLFHVITGKTKIPLAECDHM